MEAIAENPYVGWNEDIKKYLGRCSDEHVYIGNQVIFTCPQYVELDHHVRIDPFTLVTARLQIGHHSHVGSHVLIGGGSGSKVKMGKWTTLVYGSKLLCGSEDATGEHGPINAPWGNNKVISGDITIEDFGVVFSNCLIMPGITIPEGCVIGAGSTITKKMSSHLEPWSVYLGTPPRLLYRRNKGKILELAEDPKFLKFG